MEFNMENTITIHVPFSGFYHSLWEMEIDGEIESQLDDYGEGSDDHTDDTDYKELYQALAHNYLTTLMEEMVEETQCHPLLHIRFKKVVHPSEYNFQTDVLAATIPTDQLPQILAMTDWKTLAAMIEEECSDRSGFTSFVSPDIEDWFAVKPESWRPGQWELVLRALFATYGVDWEAVEEKIADTDLSREIIAEFVNVKCIFN